MKHPIDKAMATLAFSQSLMDKLHAPDQPQEATQTPQNAPQQEQPTETKNDVQEVASTIKTGLEAAGTLAETIKETTN